MADQPGPSGTSAPEETPKTEEECKKLLYQGEVMIIRQRYPEAVDLLEDCVKNMARIHGDGNDAIGEAYLYYGRALLGMEQMDESLFQKNVDGAVEEEESSGDEEEAEGEDDNEEGGEGGEEGEEEAANGEDGGKEQEGEAGDAEDAEVDAETTDSPAPVVDPEQAEASNGPSTSNGTVPSAENGVSAAAAAAAEADEQITNMQVAWEVTELARKIFLARGSDNVDDVKKLGRAYATLAEIAMVSGQFADSEADFGRAYDILAKTDDTLREQAEILYLRSNALVSCNRFDEAKEVLTQALDKLSDHQEKLRQKADEEAQKEIEEVESVKDQLKSKFEEIDIAREDIAKFREQKEKLTLTNGTGSSKSPVKAPPPDAPVRDISHLVRRRKKPDGEGDGQPSAEGSEAKKVKIDGSGEGSNGSMTTNGEASAANAD